ncbi:MAG: ABC transporter substrate-binding protein [Thermoleophilia bacterium]
MSRRRPRLIVLAVALAAVLGAGVAQAQAAASRVVALEWDGVESLTLLGVKPVGAADLAGYDHWVPVRRPGGIEDVGTRQAPSLTRIASLRPDLIVVPDHRATSNLSSLRKIAPVLVTHPFPSGGNAAQFNAMIGDFRKLASAVGKKKQGEAVVKGLLKSLAVQKAKLKKGKRAGIRITIAAPGGSVTSPGLRIFTSNSPNLEVVRRLGLKNAWTGANQRFGYTTVGVEALRSVQNGWLAFVYPKEFEGIINRFTAQDSFTELQMVKRKRVRKLSGNTWLYGGPGSTRIFAERLTAALLTKG